MGYTKQTGIFCRQFWRKTYILDCLFYIIVQVVLLSFRSKLLKVAIERGFPSLIDAHIIRFKIETTQLLRFLVPVWSCLLQVAFFNADKNFIKSKEHGSGNTALHMACRHGHFVSIGKIISRHLYLNFLRRPKKTEKEKEITKLLRLSVWENYKCLRRPCGTFFRHREFHFSSRLSLYYILLVESSFPSWQFIFAILGNAFKLYAFILSQRQS